MELSEPGKAMLWVEEGSCLALVSGQSASGARVVPVPVLCSPSVFSTVSISMNRFQSFTQCSAFACCHSR